MVNPLPIVTIEPIEPLCIDIDKVPLVGSPLGGTFSGTGVIGNMFNLSVAGIGSHVITYTYTDGNGCTNSATTTIVVNPLPEFVVISDPECTDYAQAYSITVQVNEGVVTSNYGVSSPNGNNSWTITGIPKDTDVTLTVTNDNGCDDTITIQAPDCICIELDYEFTDVTCFGLNDGTIKVNFVTEGATVTINGQPYSPDTLYGPGTYTVSAFFDGIDIDECIITEVIEITQPEKVNFDVTFTNVSCYGANDGTITVSNLSEGAVYIIQRNGYGPDLSGQSTFAPGNYVISASLDTQSRNLNMVYDAAERYDDPCVKVRLIRITEPQELRCEIIADFTPSQLGCSMTNETFLTAETFGGTGAVSYSWQLSAAITGWAIMTDPDESVIYFKPGPGSATFTVTITDENGCESECSITFASGCKKPTRRVKANPNLSFLTNNSVFAGLRTTEMYEVQLYPNPIKDKLSVKFDEEMTSEVRVEIFDLIGTNVLNKVYDKSEANAIMIDFSNFKSQLYHLKITTDKGVIIKKVVLDK